MALHGRARYVKRLILLAAIIGTMVSGLTLASTTKAWAYGCVTSGFYMELSNATSFFIAEQGHNNPVQIRDDEVSVFCLQDTGSNGWYTFKDAITGECLNVGTNLLVYEDTCENTTPEQFNQSIPGDHMWENRHYGSDNGILSSDATQGDPVFTSYGGATEYQSWATPTAH